MGGLYLLDYGAGNVRSLANAINRLGYEATWVQEPGDILKADVSISLFESNWHSYNLYLFS